MSLRDDLRVESTKTMEVSKILGGGMLLAGALTDNKTLEFLGGMALLGSILSQDKEKSPFENLNLWRNGQLDIFNNRVDLLFSQGRWGENARYGNNTSAARTNPIETILATPGFFGERTSR